MITVKELRNMFLNCPEDWNIEFRKWEHGNPEDFIKRNHYPMPNLVSIQIKEVVTKANNDHEWINHTFIVEDDFEDNFIMNRDEMIEFFCGGLADYELISFELKTEEGNIPLTIEVGDKGYSDKIMMINLEEN